MDRIVFSHNKDIWETPKDFFETLNKEFNFTLDVAASENNTLCGVNYIDEKIDALGINTQWYNSSAAFGNPPYSKWQKFVAKAYEQWLKHGFTIVMLLPARTDTKAFHNYIWDKENNCPKNGIEVRFLQGRLKFEIDGKPVLDKKGHPQSAPFPSMIVIFRGKS